MLLLLRSRDDSVENLFEDDEIVGDLPIDEGIYRFSVLSSVVLLIILSLLLLAVDPSGLQVTNIVQSLSSRARKFNCFLTRRYVQQKSSPSSFSLFSQQPFGILI